MAVDEENEEGTEEKKKGFPKVIIFIIVGMLLLSAGAFVAVKFIFLPSSQEEVEEEKTEVSTVEEFEGKLFSFEQAIIVNLAETNGQRYLKVNLQLEMNKTELINELRARTPQLMDMIITVLSSKTIDDVSAAVGRNRLKREIIDRVNSELVTGKVINIFFTEFVIQ